MIGQCSDKRAKCIIAVLDLRFKIPHVLGVKLELVKVSNERILKNQNAKHAAELTSHQTWENKYRSQYKGNAGG